MNNTGSAFPYTYDQQNYMNALRLMRDAVQGEKADREFYEYLISVAPTEEDKEIITSIRNDEIRHNQMFKTMYKQLTGQDITDTNGETFVRPASFEEGVRDALKGELRAVEKYRDIRKGLPYRYYRDQVFEILTDELKHASLYNYIFAKNHETEMGSSAGNREKTPDEWVQYIDFLVNEGLEDVKRGVNMKHILQEFILMGVLVGKGYSPENAYETVENWEKTGESKLLQQSKNMQ